MYNLALAIMMPLRWKLFNSKVLRNIGDSLDFISSDLKTKLTDFIKRSQTQAYYIHFF